MLRKLFPVLIILCLVSCKNNPNKTDQQQGDSMADTLAKNEVPAERLIIPGKQIGIYKLNEKAQPILKDLGQPDESDAGMGKAMLSWGKVKGDRLSVFIAQQMGIEDFSRIRAVRTLSSKFKSRDKLGVGSSLTELNEQYRLTKIGQFTEKEETYALWGDASGIGFEIDAKETCHGVVVIKEGTEPQQTYIPFYDNFQEKK